MADAAERHHVVGEGVDRSPLVTAVEQSFVGRSVGEDVVFHPGQPLAGLEAGRREYLSQTVARAQGLDASAIACQCLDQQVPESLSVRVFLDGALEFGGDDVGVAENELAFECELDQAHAESSGEVYNHNPAPAWSVYLPETSGEVYNYNPVPES